MRSIVSDGLGRGAMSAKNAAKLFSQRSQTLIPRPP